jgi:DNA-binding XRE family transcriptional regulator
MATYKLLIVCDKTNRVDLDPALLQPNEFEGFGRIEGVEVRTSGGETLEIHFAPTPVESVDDVPVNRGVDTFVMKSTVEEAGRPYMTRKQFKDARKAAHCNQRKWGTRLGISTDTVIHIERGESVFTVTKDKVNKALGVRLCGDFRDSGSARPLYTVKPQ